MDLGQSQYETAGGEGQGDEEDEPVSEPIPEPVPKRRIRRTGL